MATGQPLALAAAASLLVSTCWNVPMYAEPPAAARTHWAFQKVSRPDIPVVQHTTWGRTPLDAFVLAAWEKQGIEPGPAADKRTLIRRATLDLTGLPPTPEEVEAFVADTSETAFATVVNRLLDSPHYGERWARHWLDLARYAESEGFKADETRPNAWRYRDYVIESFNQDKPYDRFVREQIAGDELWPAEPAAQIATAFNRHYPDESNARNLRQRRQEILNDITDTVGSVFIGLTYACARCHDHKFDPISQLDYYRLQAFFANTAARDDVVLLPTGALERHREKLANWEAKTRVIREEMAALEAPARRAIEQDYFDKYPEEIRAILNKPEAERNPFERQMAWKARQYLDPNSHEYIGDTATVVAKLKGENKKRWQELKRQLDGFSQEFPGPVPVGSAMVDLGGEAPRTFLLNRGAFDKPTKEVAPGLLQVLYPNPPALPAAKSGPTTGRRTALANLLVEPQNPLTARVIANRVWQYHFGQGLVGTSSDFGLRGERPTNPRLLDWLSSEFVRNGWHLKSLHRLVLNSSVYQLSSLYREGPGKVDPANRLLWRFPRERLPGEVIRDAALAVAGLLNPKMGGPSVFPELPAGMPTPRGGWKVSEDASERNRRSVYVFVRRNTRYPMFDSFDMPDPHESCARRNITISPLQALTLFNGQSTREWAQGFAKRVVCEAGPDEDRQVEQAFRLAFGRSPDSSERQTARNFFREHAQVLAGGEPFHPQEKGPSSLPSLDSVPSTVLVDFCHTLLNANEFVYRN